MKTNLNKGENMESKNELIANGTHFSKCTQEQKQWAKQYDKAATEYYEQIWSDPKKYCLELTDPIWRNNRWEDVEW